MPHNISIRGLDYGISTCFDVYKPILKPFNPYRANSQIVDLEYLRRGSPIEHLGTSTVWTGLMLEDAMVIQDMHKLLIPCLEDLLATQLHGLDTAARQRFYPFQDAEETHLIKFSVCDLIYRMFGKMRLALLNTRSLEAMMELVLLFLLSLDSFEQLASESAVDTAVRVELRPGFDPFSETIPPSVANVVPAPDYISFPDIDVLPREGTEIRLIPRYHCGPSNKEILAGVSYTVVSPQPWLKWDESISGFKGTIPLFSECRGRSGHLGEVINYGREGPYAVVNLLRIEIKASVTEHHSTTSISLRRSARGRVSLKVIPWYARKSFHVPSSSRSPIEDVLMEKETDILGEKSLPDHGHPLPQEYTPNDYDVKKIFTAHLPYHTNDMSHKHPKYIHELFGTGEVQQDVQVFHLNASAQAWQPYNPNRTAVERWNGLSDAVDSNADTTASGIGFRHTSRMSGATSDASQNVSHRPGIGSLSRRSRGVSSKCSEDSHVPDSDYRKSKSLSKRRRTERDTPDSLSGNTRASSRSAPRSIDDHEWFERDNHDEFHWQDSKLFDEDFFDQHERSERRRSLHHSSPELHRMVQELHTLHQGQHFLDRPLQDEWHTTTSALHNQETMLPTRLRRPRLSAFPESSHNHDAVIWQTSSAKGSPRSSDPSEADESSKAQGKGGSTSPMVLPNGPPHITRLNNRYSVLRSLRDDSAHTDNLFPTFQGLPPTPLASPTETDVSTSDSEIQIITERQGSSESQKENEASFKERKIDSGCYDCKDDISDDNSTGTGAAKIPTAQTHLTVSRHSDQPLRYSSAASQDDPSVLLQLYEFFREDVHPHGTGADHAHPPSVSTLSNPAVASDSCDQLTVFSPYPHCKFPHLREPENIDHNMKLEQAQLWDALHRSSNQINSDNNDQRDWKLEAEERLGLWEVLQLETRQKRYSEGTDGVDSIGESEIENLGLDEECGVCECREEACRCDKDGEDHGVRSRQPSDFSEAQEFEDGVEATWNFGC